VGGQHGPLTGPRAQQRGEHLATPGDLGGTGGALRADAVVEGEELGTGRGPALRRASRALTPPNTGPALGGQAG